MYTSECPSKKTKFYMWHSDDVLKVYIRRNDKNWSFYPGISGQWSDGTDMRLDLNKESGQKGL